MIRDGSVETHHTHQVRKLMCVCVLGLEHEGWGDFSKQELFHLLLPDCADKKYLQNVSVFNSVVQPVSLVVNKVVVVAGHLLSSFSIPSSFPIHFLVT